tara:strand:+ start:399 stop:1808 length:1410 start_codon:yes stop_codon:yes gene_type:complete
MKMALETFFLIEKYLTVVLIVVASFLWLAFRKQKGEENLAVFKIHRVYTIMVIICIPFIVSVMAFIPENISVVTEKMLIILVFLSLFVVLLKLYKRNSAERMKYLRELLDSAKKNPIRYEFARKVVGPEMKKLAFEKEKILRKENHVKVEEKKLKRLGIELSKKNDKLKFMKRELLENISNADNKSKEARKLVDESKATQELLNSRIKNLNVKEKKIEDVIENYAKKRLEFTNNMKFERKEILKKGNEDVENIRKKLEKKLDERESYLDELERELRGKEREIKRREKGFSGQKNELERLERESQKRLSDVRKKEIDLQDEIQENELLKKKLKNDKRKFDKDADEFESTKMVVLSKDKKTSKREDLLNKRTEKLNVKENELLELEDELEDERKEVNKNRGVVGERRKKVEKEEVKLKRMQNFFEKERADFEAEREGLELKTVEEDEEIGEIIDEKKIKKRKNENGKRRKR